MSKRHALTAGGITTVAPVESCANDGSIYCSFVLKTITVLSDSFYYKLESKGGVT